MKVEAKVVDEAQKVEYRKALAVIKESADEPEKQLEQPAETQFVSEDLPMNGSVEEFLHAAQMRLREAPLLQEFIVREHIDNKRILELTERLVEHRLTEYEGNLSNLESEVATLRGQVAELQDNFNMFAKKLLENNEQRLALVQRAVLVLEKELSYP